MEDMNKLANSKDNRVRIELLSKIKGTQWVGNTTHPTLQKCLVAINLESNNSGHYEPIAVRVPRLTGYYMINEDGSLYFESRVVKLDEGVYQIEYMTMSAYNEFERDYEKLMD